MERLGRCLETYWEQKKLMAPGCEPIVVSKMLRYLRPHLLGACMAGAGGGGFLYLLMREPSAENVVQEELSRIPVSVW